MCLAIPGKIIEKNGNKVIVDYIKEKREGRFVENTYEIGDFVIMQGGVIVMKVSEKEAKHSLELYSKL